MKKIFIAAVLLVMIGCQSTGEKIAQQAATCNNICKDNPNLSHFSAAGGGGLTLLFVGGAEITCGCQLRSGVK
ncbi:MAG: hypothetical protein J0L53_06050 [Spirochaetes bacterium]|nr:hypothetical protein [Spirochaetota bacterium]MBX3720445.1 hypothetical protein [Turneriella sp.]